MMRDERSGSEKVSDALLMWSGFFIMVGIVAIAVGKVPEAILIFEFGVITFTLSWVFRRRGGREMEKVTPLIAVTGRIKKRTLHHKKIRIRGKLFENIIGHDNVKEILIKSITKNLGIHWLLVGPPASARSMILMDIEDKVPGAVFVSGTRLNKEGLLELLRTQRPRFLLIDELDKCGPSTLNPLLTLCEHKRIVSTTKGDPFDIKLDTIVLGTANYSDNLESYFLSRFSVLHFPEYTEEEFLGICRKILPRKEKIGVRLAKYIGNKVWNDMENRDIRQAVRVAKLAKTEEDVDWTVEVLMKYGEV